MLKHTPTNNQTPIQPISANHHTDEAAGCTQAIKQAEATTLGHIIPKLAAEASLTNYNPLNSPEKSLV